MNIDDFLQKVKEINGPLAGFAEAQSYFERLKLLRNYYRHNHEKIMSMAAESLTRTPDSYPVEWNLIFTPIERQAWEAMRTYGVMLYPQYPIDNYFVDFAHPYLKIVIELDGAKYHDKKKDTERDQKLLSKGWKVYRVTGSEMNRLNFYTLSDMYQDGANYCEVLDKITYWVDKTGDGFIRAVYEVFFRNEVSDDIDSDEFHFYQLCKNSLEAHRLVK